MTWPFVLVIHNLILCKTQKHPLSKDGASVRNLIREVLRNRFVRFAGTGLLCLLLVQLPIMLGLMEVGVTALPANAMGFLLSAVVNFYLQNRFTFGNVAKGSSVLGLSKFLGTSLVSLAVSSFVTGMVYYNLGGSILPVVSFVRSAGFGLLDTWAALAAFTGAVCGTGFNFTASWVFNTFGRPSDADTTVVITVPEETEQVPTLAEVRRAVRGETLAVFMPAYNEGQNLPTTVGALLKYLRSLNLFEFKLYIVNDGSPDDTGAVAEKLKMAFPGVVEVIHHKVNRGYGGALITGFNAVVESGLRLWAFCDSDGQFDPRSFGTLLVSLFDDNGDKAADLAVGRRIGRRNSDSAWRFWLGRAWHFFGRFVVGINAEGQHLLSVHDVDCGIKAGFTKSLARIVEQLGGQAAAISPELIARTNLDCQVITERGVTHLSRLAGTSTGDNPKVMIRSAVNIILLGLRLRKEILFGWVSDPAEDAKKTLTLEGWNIK